MGLVRQIKRVLILVDESNVVGSAKLLNKRIDWPKLRDYLLRAEEGRELVEMIIYVGLPPVAENWAETRKRKLGFVHYLRTQGFLVVTKDGTPRGEDYKANVDVLMGIDAMAISTRIEPDLVVLVTGDADFAHLATELRRQGIRVEVAATKAALGVQLQSSANKFIELDSVLTTFEDLYADDQADYQNHRKDDPSEAARVVSRPNQDPVEGDHF
ncbi:MAG: NYN domain-containing protein [Deltaproteobacteria bacterium]|nr:NYN domain-containing protein [Deltaproteobacteria bacterium]